MPKITNHSRLSSAGPVASSERYKESGNRLFTVHKYSAALACYKRGLEELPLAVDVDDTGEIRSLEVALRSNIALSLLKLATSAHAEKNGANVFHAQQNQSNEGLNHYFIECEKECSLALELDPSNTKILYRRAQACELLARCVDGTKSKDLLLQAKNDLIQCQTFLQEQLKRQKCVDTPCKVTKATKQQIIDAKKLLEKIGKSNKTEDKSASKNKSNSTPLNLHVEKNIVSTQKDNKAFQISEPMVNGTIAGVGSPTHNNPSPAHQRECIIRLLLRQNTSNSERNDQTQQIPPLIGEAFFLINMTWWENWCRYANFFRMYTHGNNHSDNHENGVNKSVDARHVAEVDLFNEKIVSLLPPGATIPPYIERDKKEKLGQEKKKKKIMSSESSSSSESSDDDSVAEIFHTLVPPPGVIDNSALITRSDKLWGHNFTDETNHAFNDNQISMAKSNSISDKSKESLLLRDHLVRGYHYEILPREAYAALRSWYGECGPHIFRRAEDADKLPWISNQSRSGSHRVRLALYREQWNTVSQSSHENMQQSSTKRVSKCGACRSPSGRFRCTKCFCVRYCNKDCQMSHWPYHKSICKLLTKQQDQNQNDNRGLIPEEPVWGRVGLNNLGNTCFMSAAIQCMSHVAPLTRFFLSNRFSKDVNADNILGTGGKVATAYGAVMKDVWMGGHQHRSMNPTALKRAIELFAPRFSGVSQQDSAEFLAYLLDALHEDLNRVRNPPYVEMPDVDKGRQLSICGAEAWDAISRRNSSFVFDNFYGLYNSTCVCPKCEEVSVTFETFNHITLEIPRQVSIDVVVILVRDEVNSSLPMRYCFQIPQNGTVEDLKSTLSHTSMVPMSKLSICNVSKCNITSIYKDQQLISSMTNADMIVAYETAPCQDLSHIHAVVTHNIENGNGAWLFGLPLLISFESRLSCAELCGKLWGRVKPFVMVESTEMTKNCNVDEMLKIRIVNPQGQHIGSREELNCKSFLSSTSNETLADLVGQESTENFVFFALEWMNVTTDSSHDPSERNVDEINRIHYSNFDAMTNHSSYVEYQQRIRRFNGANAVTLDQCFKSFTQPEKLDDENMWYCTHCKMHVRAMKTVSLWRLPNILVIHLKRFEYRNSFSRDKIGVLVDFPLEGFDLRKHSASTAFVGSAPSEFVADEAPLLYDLFGVTNHYGRMGYGHYTSYARRWGESGVENTWMEFDDENVVPVDAQSAVVSPAAYVLFYKRRVFR